MPGPESRDRGVAASFAALRLMAGPRSPICAVFRSCPVPAMLLTMMKAKLHRATVTQADLEYEGSIAIDRALLDASGILPHEQVDVLNITTGRRRRARPSPPP